MDLKDIKAIIDLMKKNSIAEFELEKQEFKIRLKRSGNGIIAREYEEGQSVTYALPSTPIPAMPVLAPNSPSGLEIKSPMIGTFYRAPSPEAGNYIEIGAEVNPDTVVCIIEAMKVMNEIKAEMKGTITHILVDNAKPVEFGQPLFKLKPA